MDQTCLTARLRERCPGARFLGIAIARGFALSFSKRSKVRWLEYSLGKPTQAIALVDEDGTTIDIAPSQEQIMHAARGIAMLFSKADAQDIAT